LRLLHPLQNRFRRLRRREASRQLRGKPALRLLEQGKREQDQRVQCKRGQRRQRKQAQLPLF